MFTFIFCFFAISVVVGRILIEVIRIFERTTGPKNNKKK